MLFHSFLIMTPHLQPLPTETSLMITVRVEYYHKYETIMTSTSIPPVSQKKKFSLSTSYYELVASPCHKCTICLLWAEKYSFLPSCIGSAAISICYALTKIQHKILHSQKVTLLLKEWGKLTIHLHFSACCLLLFHFYSLLPFTLLTGKNSLAWS